ncbi:duffy binding-like domain-containing protein, partial [Streptococcus australis]|uniref:duffy binding-like domain-containing protein n=1 Tax=Streptococcus australis TaxID=113107 RepID=UPI001CBDFD6D
MDKLLDYEKGEAENCLKTHKDPCPPQESLARAEVARDNQEEEEESGDEDDEEDDDDEGEEEAAAEEEETTQDNAEKVCQIVNDVLTTPGSLDEACRQKYSEPNRYWGWRCVAPSGEKSGNDGAICVPPRRRRLYVGKLEEWAKNYNTGATGNTPASGGNTQSSQESGETTEAKSQNGESSGEVQTPQGKDAESLKTSDQKTQSDKL